MLRTDEQRLETRLASARAALERGKLKRAVRDAWRGCHVAGRLGDARGLEAVIELGNAIRERASGGDLEDATTLVKYASHCLDDARAGVRRSASPFARLIGFGSSDDVKTCPDCAETVKAAARVCRYCGYRFE